MSKKKGAALTRRKFRVVLVKPWRVIFCDSCSATPGSCIS